MSLYTMRIVYGLLDREIGNWYSNPMAANNDYTSDQIRELEYNLSELDKQIKFEQEKINNSKEMLSE